MERNPITREKRRADRDVLDLIRRRESISVGELAESLGVTDTAARQRLARLKRQGLLERETLRQGRGRPRHEFRLSRRGQQTAGDNFFDLAETLWDEIRSISDPAIRRGLLGRIAGALGDRYADRIAGDTTRQRMESLGHVFAEKDIPCSVEGGDAALPVLSVHACPYPELAEKDRGVCAMEKQLFSDLVQTDLKLTSCRLDDGGGCTFEAC
ncbi:MAG: MarR family transcriptional regulator [Planctomycetota bacterium]|nr:MarR family transcriptional regulator [Planctomycetota bacterium]MEC8337933.1 MarR family transcriptional regulator [Planctomycetota bacterium]